MKDLDISEVAKQTGIPASTLRYYDEKGLIRSIGRRGAKRLYDPSVLDYLALIQLGQTAGFKLTEIAGIFGPDGPQIPRDALRDKAAGIERQIRELEVVRDGLRHVAECSAPSHLECPTFRRMMRLAADHRRRHGE
ncbi:helix-turn-helix domain-containing protein [Pseudoruegeria sp. HB172150]|uniref:helix-turn-helix domain-containing protein n=1 Tax=Pseudoruegeria sp. HB172150 TaxID=2721164 RepID=UPI001557F377|nr:helix-turn-helix domain-containing protein [Pseudoruegeria sp. HB172150]